MTGIWRARDFKGKYGNTERSGAKPSDEGYFEPYIYAAPDVKLEPRVFTSNVSIPLFDDPITPLEVEQQVRKLKSDRACGPNGVSQSIFKMLPDEWILLLVDILNMSFS